MPLGNVIFTLYAVNAYVTYAHCLKKDFVINKNSCFICGLTHLNCVCSASSAHSALSFQCCLLCSFETVFFFNHHNTCILLKHAVCMDREWICCNGCANRLTTDCPRYNGHSFVQCAWSKTVDVPYSLTNNRILINDVRY